MAEYTGVIQKKLGNALVHVIHNYHTFGRTQLVKTIFFADLIHYNLCGTLLFPSKYCRWPFGPASSAVMDFTVMDSRYSRPFFNITQVTIEQENGTGPSYSHIFEAKVDEDLSVCQEYQWECIDKAARLVYNIGKAQEISEFTHKFSLWNEGKEGTLIPKSSFQLTKEEDCSLLSNEGVYLTSFAQKFTQEFYKDIQTPSDATRLERLERNLTKLSSYYPDDSQWDICLDAYLAWDSAMMFCSKMAPDRLDNLCARGRTLVADITCSGVDPEASHNDMIEYEREFNLVCETVTQKKKPEMSDSEEASVNSVMKAIRCELGLNE